MRRRSRGSEPARTSTIRWPRRSPTRSPSRRTRPANSNSSKGPRIRRRDFSAAAAEVRLADSDMTDARAAIGKVEKAATQSVRPQARGREPGQGDRASSECAQAAAAAAEGSEAEQAGPAAGQRPAAGQSQARQSQAGQGQAGQGQAGQGQAGQAAARRRRPAHATKTRSDSARSGTRTRPIR